MNCDEFRRQWLIEPGGQSARQAEHVRQCSACASFAHRQAQFESRLLQALAVESPDDLQARIIRRHQRWRAHHAQRTHWTAAAAVAIVGLLLSAHLWLLKDAGLEEIVMSHIRQELHHLRDRHEFDRAQLNAILAPVNLRVAGEIGSVRYAGTCEIGDRLGAHLVFRGGEGPVTVLYIPGDSLSASRSMAHAGFVGQLLPATGGNLAIVGVPGEDLQAWAQTMRNKLLSPALAGT